MSIQFMKSLSNEDIKALFNYNMKNDEFIQQNRNRIDRDKLMAGDITPEEYNYLRSKLDSIVVRDSFESNEIMSVATHKVIFPYEPSQLVAATQHFNKMRLSVPVIQYDESNGIVVTNHDLTTVTPEVIEVNVSEELMSDEDVKIFNQVLNSQRNIRIENKIIEAMESTQITASSFVEGVELLSVEHKRNLSMVVPYSDYVDNPKQYDNNQFKIYLADTSNIFIGDLSAIVSNAYIDGVKYYKEPKTGVCSIIERIYNLNSVLCDRTNAIVKIVAE